VVTPVEGDDGAGAGAVAAEGGDGRAARHGVRPREAIPVGYRVSASVSRTGLRRPGDAISRPDQELCREPPMGFQPPTASLGIWTPANDSSAQEPVPTALA